MENAFNTGNQFNPDTTRPNGFVDHAAVPMQGAVNKAATPTVADVRAASPAVARVVDMAHQTIDKVADVATPTAAWLAAQRDTLVARKSTAVADARVYVSANPWQSIGVAVAAGFLLGRLAR